MIHCAINFRKLKDKYILLDMYVYYEMAATSVRMMSGEMTPFLF